jgi:hypothetical protein
LESQNEQLHGLQESFDAFEISIKRTLSNLRFQVMQGSNMWRIIAGLVISFVIISILFKIF